MTELNSWLETVTRGLPADTALRICQELTSHYEEATEDYQSQGLTTDQARQRALQDLGAATPVNNGFSEVYRGQHHYFYAIFACVFILANLMLMPILHAAIGLDLFSPASDVFITVNDVLITAAVLYVVLVLTRLLTWRYDQANLGRIMTLVGVGLVVATLSDSVARFFTTGVVYAGTEMSSLEADSLGVGLLVALSALARGCLGVGLLLLARRFMNIRIYGLGRLTTALLVIMGVCMLTIGVVTHLDNDLLVHTNTVLVGFAHLLLWVVLILLFFRVTYRSPAHPARFA